MKLNMKLMRLFFGALLLLGLSTLVGCGRETPSASAEHAEAAVGHDGHGEEHAEEGEGHGDEHGEEAATLKVAELRERGVVTAPVSVRTLSDTLRVPAEVRFNERQRAVVTTRTEGWIERIAVFANQHVRKDTLLAEIYSPKFLSAQQEYLLIAARARSDASGDAARLLKDAAQRLRILGLTDAEIRELKKTRKPIAYQHVHSPIDGVVVSHNVSVGDTVQVGQPLFVVADLSSVWADLALNETQLSQVRPGAAITLVTQSYPERRFTGTLLSLGAAVNEATRTVTARALVQNSEGLLKPGMFAQAEIAVGSEREVLAVPAAAVLQLEGKPTVFKVEDGVFHAEAIEVGARRGDYIVVKAGLTVGDEIAVQGAFLLKSLMLKSQMGEGHAH
ncbi:MAG TPA: efflux RND transporter periplasmic adaptor subunit [Gammaproteobacteria bacterium]|nr:efflux RND transporter periplasmic adaptor subunit [Gammaproteobacteria bacterium]